MSVPRLTDGLTSRTAGELAGLIRAGQVSSVAVVEAHLERIRVVDPICNAFTVVLAEQALQDAETADRRLTTTSSVGHLHGVPVAIKDYTPTAGILTTRGSLAFATWRPEHDAPVVERLKAAGAIIVGKTTTAELAHSSFTRSRLWGVTRNPWALDRTPGGSSGGAAVAVATGCVPLAEGTDSGGSLRIPAACCGVLGFKPSRGRIPAHSGPNDFDPLVHHGPICRHPADARLFLEACQGPDDRDPASLPWPGPRTSRHPGPRRVAVSTDLGHCIVDQVVLGQFRATVDRLTSAGVEVVSVSLDWSADVSTAWLDVWAAAFATEFGAVIDELDDRCEPSLHRLVARGRQLSAVDLKSVELVQTRAWQALRTVLSDVDALMCPTLAVPVPPAEGYDDDDWGEVDDHGRVRALDMTAPFNLLGFCPVIALPNGRDADGLPTGVQLVGRRHADAALLDLTEEIAPVIMAGWA